VVEECDEVDGSVVLVVVVVVVVVEVSLLVVEV
jgi:hypothetical protein